MDRTASTDAGVRNIGSPSPAGVSLNRMHVGFVDIKFCLDGKRSFVVNHEEEKVTGSFGFVDGVFYVG